MIEAPQPTHAVAVGDDQLAVRVPDVGDQAVRAAGGVQPDDRCARQCRPAEPEHEVGHVVEQDTHVEGRRAEVPVAQLTCQARARCRLGDHLVPAPVALPGPQPHVGVADPVEQHRGDVGHCRVIR